MIIKTVFNFRIHVLTLANAQTQRNVHRIQRVPTYSVVTSATAVPASLKQVRLPFQRTTSI